MNNSTILIGNGLFIPNETFHQFKKKSEIIAVDGGANTCKIYNIISKKIIGDLDSISDENKKYFIKKTVKIIHIPEQNSTDLEKALRTIDSDIFYCFGFTGNFFDHELSLLHILQKNCTNNYGENKKIIIFSETQIFFVLKKKGEINFNTKNITISFYPLTPTTFISSSGLKYPLNNINLEQGKIIGTSNSSVNEKISWEIDKGWCLGFFPIEYSLNILHSLYDISLD